MMKVCCDWRRRHVTDQVVCSLFMIKDHVMFIMMSSPLRAVCSLNTRQGAPEPRPGHWSHSGPGRESPQCWSSQASRTRGRCPTPGTRPQPGKNGLDLIYFAIIWFILQNLIREPGEVYQIGCGRGVRGWVDGNSAARNQEAVNTSKHLRTREMFFVILKVYKPSGSACPPGRNSRGCPRCRWR